MSHHVLTILILGNWNLTENLCLFTLIRWCKLYFIGQGSWGWFMLYNVKSITLSSPGVCNRCNNNLLFWYKHAQLHIWHNRVRSAQQRFQNEIKFFSITCHQSVMQCFSFSLTTFTYSGNVCWDTLLQLLPTHIATWILMGDREISADVTVSASLEGTSFAGESSTTPTHQVSQLLQGVQLVTFAA